VGDRLRLEWKAPARNEDGTSEGLDLESARVMRRVTEIQEVASEPAPGEAPPPGPPPFRSEAVAVARVDSVKLGEAKAQEEPIDPAWIGKRVEYAVVYENGRGRESQLSEIARIEPVAALPPPGPPQAEARDGFVALSWTVPAEAPVPLSFAVYRRLRESKVYPEAPLNPEPLSSPSFEDKTVVFGAESCYVVASLVPPSSSISSLPSEESCITPKDRFPPESPSGLVALPSEDAILLSWREVDAPDRKGYRVYRGASASGPFEHIAEVTETSYRDGEASPGERLFYRVTAIDNAPGTNESAPSEVVEARRGP
jgi:hypothetical protein